MNSKKDKRSAGYAEIKVSNGAEIYCSGAWTTTGVGILERRFRSLRLPLSGAVVVDAADITEMDTAGAWLFKEVLDTLAAGKSAPEVRNLEQRFESLVELVNSAGEQEVPRVPPYPGILVQIGKWVPRFFQNFVSFLAFSGESVLLLFRALLRPSRIRWKELLKDMRVSGVNALGIVGLLSFLIGVVITYQGAAQLRLYGANIYVVDLVGLSLFRELAPLMAAIIVAGRTSSSYAAQIGTMVVTEEVAALQTMGLAPLEVLVIPKILSLVLVLPLLTVFADICGIAGGMTMAKLQLDLGPQVFFNRLEEAVSLRSFYLGLGKAPIFAAIIATIGCYQGFKVRGGAESVGHRTTVAVVHSIFFVIVVDAIFSIMYSWLGI